MTTKQRRRAFKHIERLCSLMKRKIRNRIKHLGSKNLDLYDYYYMLNHAIARLKGKLFKDRFIEYEIDGYFMMDDISTKDSGLPYDIFVTINDNINNFPYIFCKRNNKDLSDAIIVSIEELSVMRGSFNTEDEETKVKQFIVLNKELFLDYWNGLCSTHRLFEEIQFLK